MKLTALTGSNTTLAIYYKSGQCSPTIESFSQYEIHIKPFFNLIVCVT